MLNKEPPWYVKLPLIVVGALLACVAAWGLVAVLSWGLR